MIKELVKLANHLDSKGFVKEADYLDRIIKSANPESEWGDTYARPGRGGQRSRRWREGDSLNTDAPERGDRYDAGKLKLKPEIDDQLQEILLQSLEKKGLPVKSAESSEETHGYFKPMVYHGKDIDGSLNPHADIVRFIEKRIILKYPSGNYNLVSSLINDSSKFSPGKNTPLDAETTARIDALFGGARTVDGQANEYTLNPSWDGGGGEMRKLSVIFSIKRPFLAADMERFTQK